MYIIVAGGGKVGYYLGKTLIAEGHEVLIIEKDARKVDRITDDLGSVVMQGDACEAAILADAGTVRSDMVVAVTGDDEDNLVICQLAKKKFDVPRTIARINNPKNEDIFKRLGIDVTISSTNVILEQIEHEVPSHPLIHLLELRGLGLEIVEVRVPANSPVVGKTLRDIQLPPNSVVAVVMSQSRGLQIPTGETTLGPNDEIVAVTKPESEAMLRRVLSGV